MSKNKEKNKVSQTSVHGEFYNIPLFGAVHIERDGAYHGDYNIGEIITNISEQQQTTFNLRAADDGLAEAGIYENDFLTVSQKAVLRNGDIAAVRLGHRIYIRKIFFDKKHIRLETASRQPTPLIVEENTPGFAVLGKVTTVIREL